MNRAGVLPLAASTTIEQNRMSRRCFRVSRLHRPWLTTRGTARKAETPMASFPLGALASGSPGSSPERSRPPQSLISPAFIPILILFFAV